MLTQLPLQQKLVYFIETDKAGQFVRSQGPLSLPHQRAQLFIVYHAC